MDLAPSPSSHPDTSRRIVVALLTALVLGYAAWQLSHSALVAETHILETHAVEHIAEHAVGAHAATHAAAHAAHPAHPAPPALYSVVPFAVLLLGIALLPLWHVSHHWWEKNSSKLKVALAASALTLVYYAFAYGEGVIDHATHELSAPGIPAAMVVLKNALLGEYIPFIVLLFSLYVISGGVAIEGRLVGKPSLNSGLLLIGGTIASLVGTTGAAMLLIRPLLRANAKRHHVAHTVVFFTFVVCNTGGCLLPIGDPPLFLGYLRGVPFTWTLSLWPMWAFMNLSLLAVYFVWDAILYRREDRAVVEAPDATTEPFAIRGALNFVWMAGVILAVALLDPSKPLPGTAWHAPLYFREVVMIGLSALSLALTSARLRQQNSFSYDAILEVAALFVGIFICMQAPVQLLNAYGPQLGFDTPTKFFWGTGFLSSFLDNAPTYVVFYETAKTLPAHGETVAGVQPLMLMAISLGSVFMGAMTYIGNGPNFMVKAIAEKHHVRMPSFFGYMIYSCAVLLPLSAIMAWLFF